ncbi:iron-containing alcohol dehydrogenase [Flammeovirga agarivorans]|uniref:Iron-containing alcohol dehydrogenase family protein n=1 Tax=Flammeovirga agarivorans TaxID=2726742 RepID=A0A7X8SLX6_9BACT|nr:iron-containing alcohol dehydrogenase [Flammeovirga agarivorans]NLR92661.1 iron-containing alcohol dehydrogenase family protein [Flammeovirga agarivorans]
MFYKHIPIPVILEIGNQLVEKIPQILKDKSFYFPKIVVFTSSFLGNRYADVLEKIGALKTIHVNEASILEVERIILENDFSADELFIGFGGGSVIDVVKLISHKTNNAYLSVPSTLSNDGLYSPISRLINKSGKKESYGVTPPLGIIADINIIKKSPKVNILSGVGDLVSNLNALKDWELSNQVTNEKIDNFAVSLSLLSANSILEYAEEDLKNDEFLITLANGLVISGLAMVISGNSRPASGAEHLISHAIDELYPEDSTLHGLQVAFGQILIEQVFLGSSTSKVQEFYKNIGLTKILQANINFSDEQLENILLLSSQIRKNRYTVLDNISISNISLKSFKL